MHIDLYTHRLRQGWLFFLGADGAQEPRAIL